ncbi:hypothetical protein ACFVY0_34010 [Streptomyces sp. NPDC058286]|uniref:hypothetical protein n=1 Tax=Streptomyces sp. NPDC058286 TaxID=3346422 RepID=UPI0036E755FD
MIISVPAMVGGAVAVLGAGMTVRALMPARPSVDALLKTTRSPAPHTAIDTSAGRFEAFTDKMGDRLVATPTVASRLPVTDLRLLEMSPAKLLGRCARMAVVGMVLPQLFMLLLTLGGKRPPLPVPVVLALAVGGFFAFKCLDDVRDDAKKLREEYRYTIVSLLERLILIRSANASAGESLLRAASVGDTTPALQIREALEHARLTGTTYWSALADLGRQIGVEDLARPARAMALAGEEKAAVTRTLENQVDLLNAAVQGDRETRANQATEQMDLPALTVGLSLVVFCALPAFIKILNL